MANTATGDGLRPILPAARQSFWRVVLTLWLDRGTFRSFVEFALIGGIVLAFLHGLNIDLSPLWRPFAEPKAQLSQTQLSTAQPPGQRDEKLPITPHLDEVVFGEAYFATVEEPLRTHLIDASRAYAAHDYGRMLDAVAADDPADRRVELVRGTAMVRSSDHDTFIRGLEQLIAAGKLEEPKAIAILGVLRLVGFAGYPQDIPRGRALLQRAADLGDVAAARVVGAGYISGWMGVIDPDRAAGYLRKASDSGDTEATFQLAKILSVGLGVEKNQSEADQLMLKAAQAGHLDAQMTLGLWQLRAYSAGLMASPDTALAWLKRASDREQDDATYALGVFYMISKPAQYHDPRRGAELLQLCAIRSLSAACTFAYATALEQGIGVPIDRTKAYAFYELSQSAQATPKSRERLQDLKALMSPAEIAAADALVVKLREDADFARQHHDMAE